MQSWSGHDSSGYDDIQAILSATGDPSIFQLSHFDPNALLEHPTGQLEVSLGQMVFPGFEDPIPNLSDFSSYYTPEPYPADIDSTAFGGNLASLFPTMETNAPTSHDFGGNYNADDFLNFDDNSSDASSSRPAPAVEQRSPDTNRPYAPPSGAALSSTRRVGASWTKPPPFVSGSPIEQSPTRSTWSVHA